MKTQIFSLLGLSLCLACTDYTEDPIQPVEIFQYINATPALPEADGESLILIEVGFPTDITKEKATAEIRTSAGTFKESGKDLLTVGGNLELQSDGSLLRKGRAYLISPTVDGTILITTQIAGYRQTKEIVLKPAYADYITLESDKLAIKKGLDNSAVVTVSLGRNPGRGKPSLTSEVSIKLTDLGGNERGVVKPTVARIGADGKAKFLVSRGTEEFPGPLVITATNQQGAEKKTQALQLLLIE